MRLQCKCYVVSVCGIALAWCNWSSRDQVYHMLTAHQSIAGGSSGTSLRSPTLCTSMSSAAAAAQIVSNPLFDLAWLATVCTHTSIMAVISCSHTAARRCAKRWHMCHR